MKLILILLLVVSCSLENVNEEVKIQEAKLDDQVMVEGGSLPILDITSLAISFTSLSNVTYSCYFDQVVDDAVERDNKCTEIDGVQFNSEFGIMTWNAEIMPGHRDEVYEILIVATDGKEESSDIFEVTIFDINNAPKLATPVVVMSAEGEIKSLTTYDVNTSNVFDIDRDPIIFSCKYVNGDNLQDCSEVGVIFNTTTSRHEWTMPYTYGHENKSYTFIITGTDGELSDSVTFTYIVGPTQQDPQISSTNNQVVFEGKSISEIDFYDTHTGSDYDRDNDLLRYTCYYDLDSNNSVPNTNPCSEIFVNFNSRTGTFNWTPPYNLISSDSQDYEFKITTTDENTTSETFFTIKVFNKIEQSYKDVCTGDYHSCAIKSDGMIYCWGDNSSSQLASNANSYLRPNKVNVDNLLETDSSLSFKKISCGGYHNCALSNRNDLYCWGYNGNGQLGNNTNEMSNSLVKVNDSNLNENEFFQDVSSGFLHNCALTNLGKIYCWGLNNYGQLGLDSSGNKKIPYLATEGFENKYFKKIASGQNHNCAINDEGFVYCWGHNNFYQSGLASPEINISLNKVGSNKYVDLALGLISSCAINVSSNVECWGSNNNGAFGVNNNDSSLPDNHIPRVWSTDNLMNNKAISLNSYYEHYCSITDLGELFCWGDNQYGQQGNNISVTDNLLPTKVVSSNSGNFKKVATGKEHTCGININGELYCWGSNFLGQLGDGTTTNSSSPVKVDDSIYPVEEEKFYKVLVGDEFSCALSTVGLLYCWGDNDNNQFATDSISGSITPRLIVDEDNEPIYFVDFALGSDHVCALKMDYTAHCWGLNANGQLGNNTYIDSSSLVPVNMDEPDTNFYKLIAHGDVSCGMETDGDVYCWGNNEFKKLGVNQTNPYYSIPYKVNILVAQKVVMGKNHGCGLNPDGTIYCWGSNQHGQIGQSVENLEYQTAVEFDVSNFGSDNKFIDVMVGDKHTCGVSAGGKVYCAGDNSEYQVGKSSGSLYDEVVLTSWFDDYNFYKLFSASNKTFGISGNGELYYWGNGNYLPKMFNTGYRYDSTFKEVSTGTNHSCALSFSGDVYCWGNNSKGQLGVENYTEYAYPLKVNFD